MFLPNNKNASNVHTLLALLQHWFACFHDCGELKAFERMGVADREQQWQQLVELSADIQKKLLLFRVELAANEAMAVCDNERHGRNATRGEEGT